jgi:hypothetical protein
MSSDRSAPTLGDDLDHVRVDHVAAERACDRHTVVAVADEVNLAHSIDRDGRQRLAAAHGAGDPLPARAHPRRCGAELPIEAAVVAAAGDGYEDRVNLDGLLADIALLESPERVHDLRERQDDVNIARLAPEPPGQMRHHMVAPGALEVVLCIREDGKFGVRPHACKRYYCGDRLHDRCHDETRANVTQ